MKEKKRRTCQICGGLFVPTSNNQKYCPECRDQLKQKGNITEAYLANKAARIPSEVKTTTLEEIQKQEAPDPTPAELPDEIQAAEAVIDVIRRYYGGQLVEKTEPTRRSVTDQIFDVANRVCNELCKYTAADPDDDTHCADCPLHLL